MNSYATSYISLRLWPHINDPPNTSIIINVLILIRSESEAQRDLFHVDVASPFILSSLYAALIQIIPLPLQKRTVEPRNLQKDLDAQARNDDLQTSLTLQQASINICVFYIKVLQMSKIPRSSLLLSVRYSSGLISHVNCIGICRGGFATHRHCSTQPGRHPHVGEKHPELQPQTQLKFRNCTQRPPPPKA